MATERDETTPDLPDHRMYLMLPPDRTQPMQLSFSEDMERDEAVQLLLYVAQQLMTTDTLHPDATS